jgi:3-oxoacyl-[acyl-carrier protein] reductase
MRKQNYGKIINVSSVVGQAGAFGTANYSASKAGIIGFTKTVAKEVARRGITANVISLGYIDIGMGRNLSEEMKSMLLQQIPLGRFGKPEEVTQTVLFLASDDASYITGQVININGGFY